MLSTYLFLSKNQRDLSIRRYEQESITVGCVPTACRPYPIYLGGGGAGVLHPGRSASGVGSAYMGGWADLPVNRMTDACENITLPQTSFVNGKYSVIKVIFSSFNHYLQQIDSFVSWISGFFVNRV